MASNNNNTKLDINFLCLVALSFFAVSTLSNTPKEPKVKVVVTEGDDAVLPCSISPIQNLETKVFDWSKDGGKEVFLYYNGDQFSNGRSGQDPQFTGRVSHFPEQLKDGNASIKIQRTTVADSGNYTCVFPDDNMQTSVIELLVGASPRPHLTVVSATEDTALLKCVVEGAHAKPEVALLDSSGNVLPAEETQVSERDGRYYVTTFTTMKKSGRVTCRVTQKDINHETFTETFVSVSGKADEKSLGPVIAGSLIGGLVLGALCLAVVLWLLVQKEIIIIQRRRGTLETQNGFALETASGSAAHGSHPTAGDPASEPLQPISDV